MNEYIKEVKDYDIFITVPDSLKSIDMREVQNFFTNISRDWDYPWLGHDELKIGLEANSSNAVFLFPNLLFAWPKYSLRAAHCVGVELRYSNKDRSINIPDHVTTIINTDKERYAGADTIMIYNLDLEVPLLDTYNHCIGVYLRTYGHHALPLKIALTDEGLKNADQYINTLFDMVKIGSNPHPEYLKAEEETKTDRDLYE